MLNLPGWAMVTNLICVFFGAGLTPATWQRLVTTLLGTWEGSQILRVGTYAGGFISLCLFSISAVSVPMVMVPRVSGLQALHSGWTAMRLNPRPTRLWGTLLSSMTLVGILTLSWGRRSDCRWPVPPY